jgi:hypothetical protein
VLVNKINIMATEFSRNNRDRMEEETRKKNDIEPAPHRGENNDLEDIDPKYKDKAAEAYQENKGSHAKKDNEEPRKGSGDASN